MKPSYEDLERRITELEKIEQDYNNILEKYSVLFNRNPDGIAVIDPSNASIIEFNDQLCKQLGYTRDEFKLLRIPDLDVVETEEDTKLRFKSIMEKGFDSFETKQKTKSGEIKDVFVDAQYLNLNNKNVFYCIWRDITDKKATDNKLLESQLKLKTVFENSNDALYLVNESGYILETNKKAMLNTGFSKNDLMSKKIWEIQYQLLQPELKEVITINYIKNLWFSEISKIEVNNFAKADAVILTASGDLKYVEDFVTPIIIDKTKYFFISQRDITERKKAEEQIRQSEERYKALFQNNHSVMMLLEPNTGKIKDVNPAAVRFYGWSREELLQMKASNINILPEDEILKEMRNAANEERNFFLFKHRLANGEIRDVEVSSGIITVENEKLLYSIIHDVSNRIKAETRLIESERKLKLFVDHAPAAIAMFDNNMVYLAVSNRYLQDFHLKGKDIIGRSHYDIFPEMGDDRIAIHKRCLAGASETSDEDKLIRLDGSIDYVRWELYPWYENDENIGGLLFFSEVFTDRKKAQLLLKESENNLRVKNLQYEILNSELMELNNQLLIAKDKAVESDRLKTAFLQNISHEIRTPLNGILGFSKLLKIHDLSREEIDEYTDLILNSGDRLLETVNNILDMALLQTNQLILYTRNFVLNGLISDLFESYLDKANSKNIQLNYECPNDIEDSIIFTDQIRLNQILNNLINNAIKFTNEGIVEFGYNLKDNFYEFYVKDTGIGIHSQLVDRIFKRFSQVENSISRSYEGNGLGLSICKGLVELMGGKIWFDSQLNKGTSFYFTIPA